MSRNVTVSIYDGEVRIATLEDVEVEPGHEMDPGHSVLVPAPWDELIDWDSEEWDEYHVSYELSARDQFTCRECGVEMDLDSLFLTPVGEHEEGCPLRPPADPFEGLDQED